MGEPAIAVRPIVFDDWVAVHSWAGLEETSRYQAWGPNTQAETRDFVRAAVAARSDTPPRRFVHVAHMGNDVVGLGEICVRSRRHRQGEISYVVHPKVWGRGIATAIGRDLLCLGFAGLGLHRIFATCDPRNLGSARVLVKLGMSHEGRHRHAMLIRTGWRDSDIFSVLLDEWLPYCGGDR